MGLLPSSRRKQSRDLGDSAADDIYVYYLNGYGAGRRGGRSQRVRHEPVRLLRLSTELDGKGPAGTAYSGFRAGSQVLVPNGRGSVHCDTELKRLLVDTQPVARWQQPLKRLLQLYIRPEDAFLALAFLAKNMDTAISAIKNPSESLGYPALYIDIQHKPSIFNLQHWKDIMIALHFELTEPESNRDLDLVEVKVTTQVTLGSLVGFKIVVQSLSNISWDMLRMLLALTPDKALPLLTVLQNPHSHHGHADLSNLQDLYARYPDELSALGFSITRIKKKKEITWQPQSSDTVQQLEVGLIGLYHNGTLETYI